MTSCVFMAHGTETDAILTPSYHACIKRVSYAQVLITEQLTTRILHSNDVIEYLLIASAAHFQPVMGMDQHHGITVQTRAPQFY